MVLIDSVGFDWFILPSNQNQNFYQAEFQKYQSYFKRTKILLNDYTKKMKIILNK